jgi:peptidoglycan hydrolase CwlO-like protein
MTQELLIFLVGQAVTILYGWVKLNTQMTIKLKELDIRLEHIEKKDQDVSQKLDSIFNKISEIQLELSNKQNRD